MAYCTIKSMPQARGKAMRMLILEQQPIEKVALKFGVHRTTIWRWKQKWIEQNKHIDLHNTVRHKDAPTSAFRLNACIWNIPTKPAIPLHPHRLSDDLVQLVLDVRNQLGRPNDNAHIERFNRTLQEECTGSYFVRSVGLATLNQQIAKYLDYYNYKRIHLGISYRTPSEMLQRC